eukprot:COSAG04_NODE_1819_length_5500_cov_5.703573_2_plen_985_part_00
MPETDRQRAEGPEAAGEQTAAPYPEMGAAEMSAAVDLAAEKGGGEIILTDRGLKARQVACLRDPLASWSAASIVHLDLSRNRLRDKGARAIVKVLAGTSSIKRLGLEHNGIGDVGAAALGDMLRTHASVNDVNLRKNTFTDTGARALVVALHENHAIERLDFTKNKTVSFSMHEAGRLAAETNRMRHKGLRALDVLATLYESVAVIKGELGLMESIPLEQALEQACALLGVGATPGGAGKAGEGKEGEAGGAEDKEGEEGGEEGKEKGEGKLGGDGAEAAGGESVSAEGKPLLTDRAAAVIAELGLRVTPVKAQSSRDRVLRSLALGYAAQPADVAHLDSIARGAGVKIKEILGFARAQLEAEKSLAAADVNPIMEDDRTRRRRYARAQDEANKPVKAPTVLEQLESLLSQAVERSLLTEGARAKIQAKVHDGKLNPTTCMVQWSQKLAAAENFEGLGPEPEEAAVEQQARTVAPERQPDWRAVVDEQSGKTYFYNRRTRETRWTAPPGVHMEPTLAAEEDSDDDGPGFEEWELPGSRPAAAAPAPAPAPEPEPREDPLFGFAPAQQPARAEQRPLQSGPPDSVVVEFGPGEMGRLAWRETAQGTVQLARAPERVAELGLAIGMVLNSVALPGAASRVPVGMLSYAGALEQIDGTGAAGRGVSLGFVRGPAERAPPARESVAESENFLSRDDDDDGDEFSVVGEEEEFGSGVGRSVPDVDTRYDYLGLRSDEGMPRQQPAAAAPASEPAFGFGRRPQPGDRYVVVFGDGAVVRGGCEMGSALVGKLSQGQVLRVLEAQTNSDGLLRLRVEEGWVSIRASDGTPLLREAPVGLGQEVTNLVAAQKSSHGDIFEEDLDPEVLLAPPPPPKTLAEKAAASVERALEHDAAEEHAEALACYQSAATMLHAAAKEPKANRAQAAYYRNKATEYLMRSEELSEALAEQRRLDVARQRMLDTTAKQLTLAADPLGGAHHNPITTQPVVQLD